MTSAETLESTSSASVPLPASPRERQAARLALAIEAKKAEISEVLRRYADTLKYWDEKVATAAKERRQAMELLDDKIDLTRALEKSIESLKEILIQKEELLLSCKKSIEAADSDVTLLYFAENKVVAERTQKCAEPDRHVGALRKDLEKLERRLALSVAHQTSHFKALFPGVRNQP